MSLFCIKSICLCVSAWECVRVDITHMLFLSSSSTGAHLHCNRVDGAWQSPGLSKGRWWQAFKTTPACRYGCSGEKHPSPPPAWPGDLQNLIRLSFLRGQYIASTSTRPASWSGILFPVNSPVGIVKCKWFWICHQCFYLFCKPLEVHENFDVGTKTTKPKPIKKQNKFVSTVCHHMKRGATVALCPVHNHCVYTAKHLNITVFKSNLNNILSLIDR